MQKFLELYQQRINTIQVQKRSWVIVSLVFLISVISIMVEWGDISKINNLYLWIFVFSSLISTSVIWWFWTMHIMNTFLKHRKQEIAILEEIVVDIREMKRDIERLKKP